MNARILFALIASFAALSAQAETLTVSCEKDDPKAAYAGLEARSSALWAQVEYTAEIGDKDMVMSVSSATVLIDGEEVGSVRGKQDSEGALVLSWRGRKGGDSVELTEMNCEGNSKTSFAAATYKVQTGGFAGVRDFALKCKCKTTE